MTKIVFFDIDGTLWDDHLNIPESTIEGIRELRANGHKAFLCSGRSRSNIVAKELWDIGFDGIVAACGNHVEMEGKVLYENILSPQLTKRIVELAEEHHMPIVLEGPKYQWLSPTGFEDDPYITYLMEQLGDKAIEIHNGYTEDMVINKFSADILADTNYEAIKAGLEAELDFMVHDGYIVETVPKGTSKATGIAWLCQYLDVDVADTYAFGDSVNDLEMLAFCGQGIAMGDGVQAAKEAADYVTTALHEDGIYNGLKHYGLI